MKLRKIRNLVLLLALLSVVSLISFKIGREGVVTGNNSQLDLSLMWKVKAKLGQLYLDKSKIDDKKMTYGAIQGMVASLDDPYTMFLSPDQNKSANDSLTGEFGGVGISLGYKDKNLAVMSPLTGTPAEKAGLKAGDLILKITDKANNVDKDTTGMSLDEAVKFIRGKIGTEVTLKMYREGKADYFDVVLKRENIVVPSVTVEFKEQNGKKVAWVKISTFTENLMSKEWDDAVLKIKTEKAKENFGGIVLDLRNNPGGFLQASVLVASDFIKEGTVVSQQSYDGSVEI